MGKGNRYQVYGIDAQGSVTHAGAHEARRMSARVARKLQRRWVAWRRRYLESEPSAHDSPLHRDSLNPARKTVFFCMHPLGDRDAAQWFDVSTL